MGRAPDSTLTGLTAHIPDLGDAGLEKEVRHEAQHSRGRASPLRHCPRSQALAMSTLQLLLRLSDGQAAVLRSRSAASYKE